MVRAFFDGHSERFPKLLRFLALHALFGGVAGVLTAALLIASNVAALYELLVASQSLVIGTVMLCGSFAVTFASAAMGTAVMLLPRTPID